MSVFEVIVRTDRGTINLSRILSEAMEPLAAIREIRERVTNQLKERELKWFYITHVEQVPEDGDAADAQMDDPSKAVEAGGAG